MAGGSERRVLEVDRLGRTDYLETWELQKRLVARRADGEIADRLLLTEHEPVVTLGRGTPDGATAGVTVPVVRVERGGDATFHGPGQLVAYPILRLDEGRRDLHRYLRDLEEVVIRMLAEVSIEGARRAGWTGVWVGERKVCSIGVAVRRWVTYHGFALNLATDLEAFRSFRPCGLDPAVMTNVAEHSELPPTRLLFEVMCVKHLCEVFDLVLPDPPPIASPPETPPEGTGGLPSLPIFPG